MHRIDVRLGSKRPVREVGSMMLLRLLSTGAAGKETGIFTRLGRIASVLMERASGGWARDSY